MRELCRDEWVHSFLIESKLTVAKTTVLGGHLFLRECLPVLLLEEDVLAVLLCLKTKITYDVVYHNKFSIG